MIWLTISLPSLPPFTPLILSSPVLSALAHNKFPCSFHPSSCPVLLSLSSHPRQARGGSHAAPGPATRSARAANSLPLRQGRGGNEGTSRP
eukprot:177725-Hanusia_phi.AAC.3